MNQTIKCFFSLICIVFLALSSKSEVLFSTTGTAESSDTGLKARPRYWRAQAFYNNKNYNQLTKIKIRIKDYVNNIDDISKLRGRIYTSLVAWAPSALDDNKVGELSYAGSTQDGSSLIIDLVPSPTILLSPKEKYFFAFNGDGCKYPFPYWVICQNQAETDFIKSESLFYDTQSNYATKWRAYGNNFIPQYEIQVSEPNISLVADDLLAKVPNSRPRLFINPDKVAQIQNANNFQDLKTYVDNYINNSCYLNTAPDIWYQNQVAIYKPQRDAGTLSNSAYQKKIKCINAGHMSAFLYQIVGDAKYYDFALWSIKACNAYYKDCYNEGIGAYWYMFDRLKWLMAFDWIADNIPAQEKINIFSDWVKYIEFFMTHPSGECYSGPTSGNYGVDNLKFYAGLVAKGISLPSNQAQLVKNWLAEGYIDNIDCMAHRENLRGEYGGAASSTLTYSFSEYLYAPFNFIYTCRSALNEDPSVKFPKFPTIANYVLWNMIPAPDGTSYYSFGYGDVTHRGNGFPTSLLHEHLVNIRNIYVNDNSTCWDIVNYLEPKFPDKGFAVFFIYQYLLGDITTPPPANLNFPKAFCFENMGQTFMRSGFGIDDTYAMFVCGGNNMTHSHLDALAFVIYKNGFLAQDAGSRPPEADYHHWGHAMDSVCHNTLLIHEPGEIRADWNWLAKKEPTWEIYGGQNSATGSEIVAFATNDYFTYVAGDATNTYRASKAEKVTRQFIHVQPDIFVCFDRVVSTQASYRKDFILRTGNQPVISGKQISVQHETGEMIVTNLLPANSTINTYYGFTVNGVDHPIANIANFLPEQKSCLGMYRTRITSPNQAQNVEFLNFIQVGEAGNITQVSPLVTEYFFAFKITFTVNNLSYEFYFYKNGAPSGYYRVINSQTSDIICESYLPNSIMQQSLTI